MAFSPLVRLSHICQIQMVFRSWIIPKLFGPYESIGSSMVLQSRNIAASHNIQTASNLLMESGRRTVFPTPPSLSDSMFVSFRNMYHLRFRRDVSPCPYSGQNTDWCIVFPKSKFSVFVFFVLFCFLLPTISCQPNRSHCRERPYFKSVAYELFVSSVDATSRRRGNVQI